MSTEKQGKSRECLAVIKNLLPVCFWCAGGVWRCCMQRVHQACLGDSLPRNGLLTSCSPTTPLHWQWNHDCVEWHRETTGACWCYPWSRLCGHCIKVSFHKWGYIHTLLSKYCPKVCYTSLYQPDIDILNNKEYWMDHLFLRIKLRHLSLLYTTHTFPVREK